MQAAAHPVTLKIFSWIFPNEADFPLYFFFSLALLKDLGLCSQPLTVHG